MRSGRGMWTARGRVTRGSYNGEHVIEHPVPHTTTAVTHRRRPVCAAEPTGDYRTTVEHTDRPDRRHRPARDGITSTDRRTWAGPRARHVARTVRDGLTDRLPVLAELPALADLLTDLEVADAAMRRAVVALGRLDADLTVEQTTGVGLEHWLALACRHTRLDRRTLLRAARWTVRLPAFGDGLVSGRLSWTQARTLTLTLRDLPAGHDQQADQLLASLIASLPADADPDAIVDQLRRAIFRWRDATTPDARAAGGEPAGAPTPPGRHRWELPRRGGRGRSRDPRRRHRPPTRPARPPRRDRRRPGRQPAVPPHPHLRR
jgi:hypothetical protein